MDLQSGVELKGRAGLEGSEWVPQPRASMTWCVEHHVSLGMHNTMFNFSVHLKGQFWQYAKSCEAYNYSLVLINILIT